ncbi:MAG: ribonuclease Z [Lachnospiraceae bacterium]|nr:ribonuclease Z [Lachnospiraceae bacterium]
MLDVCLLGTGGMMPLPNRWLTALMLRYNGKQILIDAGEGTQIAIKEKGISVNPIDIICITHFHADHVSGLPGLFLSMGNAEKTTPLLMIGPKGLAQVVNSLRVIAPGLPFEIQFHEIMGDEESIEFDGFTIDAYKVNHSVPCYGYSMRVHRKGKFDAQRAKAQNIPLKFWNPLQKGETVEWEGKVFTPDMVLGESRKGLKVTYTTDTRPTERIVEAAKDADLFICEGMYGEADKKSKARANRHMMMTEAAEIGAKAQPKEMWLTHYSPAMMRPEQYVKELRQIFEPLKAAKDGWVKVLNFEED